jgi:hypothetical protein
MLRKMVINLGKYEQFTTSYQRASTNFMQEAHKDEEAIH